MISTAAELTQALAGNVTDILIEGTIDGLPMVTLPPGVALRGGTLRFRAKGVCLTADNVLDGVTILTADDEVAILNDSDVTDMGTLTLHDVRTRGQVLLVAEGSVRSGHIDVDGLRVDYADVRGRTLRPRGFGVEALQGALTIWNRQPDPTVTLTARVVNVAVGSASTPVRGSGIFVGGYTDGDGVATGGRLHLSLLRTGEVHTNGGIPPHTPDLISGGVFVISGAMVDRVDNVEAVTTYGPNDMVLDNWGTVDVWTARAPVTSHGPSGIGFVNFGGIEHLDVRAPIRTFGMGARGFNLYDGTLREARFAEVVTSGDGSVAIQIAKPMGSLSVTGNVCTSGGEGLSLVKGVQTRLRAVGVSLTAGADVASITVGGRIASAGDGIVTVEIDGRLGRIDVAGGITATGRGSDAVHVRRAVPGLDAVTLRADDGKRIIVDETVG